ncbi:hypothetical protein N9973_00395 [bacterium]|nr:hypothetical protein [bacterium]
MPRGKRECPKCSSLCSTRSLQCECGFSFESLKKPVKKPTYFKERQQFIRRMLNDKPSVQYKLDIITATKVFKRFENDVDFLLKVKPPFELDGSIKYFLSSDGLEYLERKHREFHYKPKNSEKMVDHKSKFGQDIPVEKRKTLRDFLDE